MCIADMTSRFYKKIEEAVAYWNLGDKENMVDLMYAVHADGFAEGCDHTKKSVIEFLDDKSDQK